MSAEFVADFFDGHSSRRHAVRVAVEGPQVAIRGDEVSRDVERGAIVVHPRLGITPVRIDLPDGGLLVASDFEAVNNALEVPRARTLAYRLESHSWFVVVALAGLAVSAWFAYTRGIPWAAREVAARIPPQVEEQVATNALDSLDRLILAPSALNPAEHAYAEGTFRRLASAADVRGNPSLVFRSGKKGLGPNAFALPGGRVLVTDELVELLDENQIAAVFAHELGHVRNQHGTRLILGNSIQALFLMAIFGDASAVASTAALAPSVLLNNGYSRDFERDADAFAMDLLKRTGASPRDLASALTALRDDYAKRHHSPLRDFGYLSTHPDINERIQAAESASDK
jgi:Zn-dependent protease with chaperone function